VVEVALHAGPAGVHQHFAEEQVRRRVVGARRAVRVVRQHVLVVVAAVGRWVWSGAWPAGSEVGGVVPRHRFVGPQHQRLEEKERAVVLWKSREDRSNK